MQRITGPKAAAGVRHVPIEIALRPLHDAMHSDAGGTGAGLVMPLAKDWVVTFRKHLGLPQRDVLPINRLRSK